MDGVGKTRVALEVARTFGARGNPAAIAIAAAGTIASKVTVGRPAILNLPGASAITSFAS